MPCCECSSCQGNCAFGSVTYFTSTRSPGANVLSQNNKARGFVCKILSEEGVSLCSARCGYTSGTAAQTSWESLFTGFEFGYFCGLLLPYLVMYYTKLLRTLFSVLPCGKKCSSGIYWGSIYNLYKPKMLGDISLYEWVVFHHQLRAILISSSLHAYLISPASELQWKIIDLIN